MEIRGTQVVLREQRPEDAGYFHAFWNRTNPLPYKEDYVILPKINRDAVLDGGVLTAKLRKASWNVFRFSVRS